MTYKTQSIDTRQTQQLAALYGQELTLTLEETYDNYFVTKKDVFAVQKLWRRSDDMRPNSFWEDVALPHTADFATAGRQACDQILGAYRTSLLKEIHKQERPLSEVDRAQVSRTLQSGSIHLLDVLPDARRIDALGKWWLGRLNTAAIKENLSEVLHSDVSQLRSLIRVKGADLCSDTSWLYGDYLLSAYELAHKELRTYIEEKIATLYAEMIQELTP